MTRILDARGLDADVIAEAVDCLRRGGLVALPTETVYGLGARALDPAALARVFAAKGRPASHPLIAHVLDLDGARSLSIDVERARALTDAFWPGPLTVVLPRASSAPAALSGGLPTVAVRAPLHPVARALIAALGEPIAAPSANRYQSTSPTTAQHVVEGLGDAVDLVLDGGATDRGIESTVVDLTAAPVLLRPGPISVAQLRTVLTTLDFAENLRIDEHVARSSPGLDARHYAPRAPALRFSGAGALAVGATEGVVLRGESLAAHARAQGAHVLVLPDDPEGYARGFYAALHALDAARVSRIWIEAPPDQDDAWAAVRDRILRATTSFSI
jgi:L-threonylcarbamoyladenylate synthase